MSFGAKREYLREIWQRYQKSTRNEKSRILDEFCEVTGLHRKYAIRILGAAVPTFGIPWVTSVFGNDNENLGSRTSVGF